MSLLLKVLFSLGNILCRGREALSEIASSYASILSSTTSSSAASLDPVTDPAIMNLFSLLGSFAWMSLPQHTARAQKIDS